jgi:outer membrane protein assembly factor BamB
MTRIACVIAAAMLLGACGGDEVVSENNALRPAELVVFEPSVPVELAWSAQLNRDPRPRQFNLAPQIRDGRIFVAERGGRVAAYDTTSGVLRWEQKLDATLSAGAGVGEGLMLVGGEDGDLFALDVDSGSLKWRATVSSEILAAPQIGAGKVLVSVNDGKVIAFDAQRGQKIWISNNNVPALSLRGGGRPVIVGERVIAGFANGHVAAFNLHNGKRLWETAVAVAKGRSEIERLVDVDTTPRVLDGTVYCATYQGQVAALSLESGQILWSRDTSTFTDLIVDESRVYYSDASSELWALDRKTGATLWRQDKLRGRMITGPALSGDHIVVGDFQGYAHWMRRDDGHFVARTDMKDADRRAVVAGQVHLPEDEDVFRVPEGILITPAVAADGVYIRDGNGILAAYRVRE